MEFKFIRNSKGIAYPVGHNFSYNIAAMNNMVKILKRLYPDSSTHFVFWTAGSSGPIIASYVASKLKNRVSINHIKPKGVNTHSKGLITSNRSTHIFIDDFIEEGNTFKMVYEKIKTSNVTLDAFCLSKKIHLECVDFIPRIIIAGCIELANGALYSNSQMITL